MCIVYLHASGSWDCDIETKAACELTSRREVGTQHSLNPEQDKLDIIVKIESDSVVAVLDPLVMAVDVCGKLGTLESCLVALEEKACGSNVT